MGSCFSIVGRMVTNNYAAGLGCSHGAGKDTVIGIALKISGVYMTSDKAVWVGERGKFFPSIIVCPPGEVAMAMMLFASR